MRLVKNRINTKTNAGSVTLIPTHSEDLWHLYNLIRPGDRLKASAERKVKQTNALGATKSTNVHTTLTIVAKAIEYDPTVDELHVPGRVCEENEHVQLGQHHTLDLALNRQFTLSKGQDEDFASLSGSSTLNPSDSSTAAEPWDAYSLQILRDCLDVRRTAEVWAVVMAEGLANVCLISENQTVVMQKVEQAIARKRAGVQGLAHDKELAKFFETTLQTLLRQIDFQGMKAAAQHEGRSLPPLLLASPGFTAQGFQKHFVEHATKVGDKEMLAYARDNVLVAHASNGQVHALNEVLRQPAVKARLSDTRYGREAQAMEKFEELLRADDGRAWYGPKEVAKAVDMGAVGRGGGILLLNNSLFRSANVAERKKWVAMVEHVGKTEGGEVRILSSAHESGRRLEALGNIGAILTFPCPDIADEIEAEEASERAANGPTIDRGQRDELGDAELINL